MRVIKVPENKGFYARVGDFFGKLRLSPKEAIDSLNDELERYHPLNHTYVRCQDGTVLHLFQIPSHNWNINIIPPSGYRGAGVGVQGTYKQTVERAAKLAEEKFGGLVK